MAHHDVFCVEFFQVSVQIDHDRIKQQHGMHNAQNYCCPAHELMSSTNETQDKDNIGMKAVNSNSNNDQNKNSLMRNTSNSPDIYK